MNTNKNAWLRETRKNRDDMDKAIGAGNADEIKRLRVEYDRLMDSEPGKRR